KSAISSREIQTVVRLILPGELSKHAISGYQSLVPTFCVLYYCILLFYTKPILT
ncbi:hypothetical protein EDB83DRAFT_2238527, partial [Lactarius deliciosus]